MLAHSGTSIKEITKILGLFDRSKNTRCVLSTFRNRTSDSDRAGKLQLQARGRVENVRVKIVYLYS